MRKFFYILTLALFSVTVFADDVVEAVHDSVAAPETVSEVSEAEENEPFDAKDVIFSHIGDAYEYHITEINGHPISVPLLVIVKSAERGWFVFGANKVTHGDTYEGFFIQKG